MVQLSYPYMTTGKTIVVAFVDVYSLHTTLPCPRLRCQCSCSRGAHTCSALQSRWTTSLCLNRLTSCLCTPYPLSLEYLSLLLPADSRPITKAHFTHRELLFLSAICASFLCRWKWGLPLLGVCSSAFPWQTNRAIKTTKVQLTMGTYTVSHIYCDSEGAGQFMLKSPAPTQLNEKNKISIF